MIDPSRSSSQSDAECRTPAKGCDDGRIVAFSHDANDHTRMDIALRAIVEGTAALSGADFSARWSSILLRR